MIKRFNFFAIEILNRKKIISEAQLDRDDTLNNNLKKFVKYLKENQDSDQLALMWEHDDLESIEYVLGRILEEPFFSTDDLIHHVTMKLAIDIDEFISTKGMCIDSLPQDVFEAVEDYLEDEYPIVYSEIEEPDIEEIAIAVINRIVELWG